MPESMSGAATEGREAFAASLDAGDDLLLARADGPLVDATVLRVDGVDLELRAPAGQLPPGALATTRLHDGSAAWFATLIVLAADQAEGDAETVTPGSATPCASRRSAGPSGSTWSRRPCCAPRSDPDPMLRAESLNLSLTGVALRVRERPPELGTQDRRRAGRRRRRLDRLPGSRHPQRADVARRRARGRDRRHLARGSPPPAARHRPPLRSVARAATQAGRAFSGRSPRVPAEHERDGGEGEAAGRRPGGFATCTRATDPAGPSRREPGTAGRDPRRPAAGDAGPIRHGGARLRRRSTSRRWPVSTVPPTRTRA